MNTVTDLDTTIVALRDIKGWSQEALAAAANINVRTVQRIEAGQPGAIEAVGAIARAFELDVDTLQRLRNGLDILQRTMHYPAVHTAPALIKFIVGAEACVHHVESEDQVLRDIAHTLVQDANDWSDLGLEPAMLPDAEKNLGGLITDLEAVGGRLFCYRRPYPSGFKDRRGQVINLDTIFLVVYPKDHPAVVRDDTGQEFLAALKDPEDDGENQS